MEYNRFAGQVSIKLANLAGIVDEVLPLIEDAQTADNLQDAFDDLDNLMNRYLDEYDDEYDAAYEEAKDN